MASLQPASGLLGPRLAGHLLRRATYKYNKSRIDSFSQMTPAQAVDALFLPTVPVISEPIDHRSNQPWINSGSEPISGSSDQRAFITSWWMHEALNDDSIRHKMNFFLHSVFVTNADADDPRPFFDYLALLNFYATGNFKTLALKVTIDRLMLSYLNGDDNTKQNPNENYAREFLELFTIGKGPQIGNGNYTNYTEEDILEAAKLLSGWRRPDRPLGGDPQFIDPDTGISAGYKRFDLHDTSGKVFSSAFNNHAIAGAVDEADMDRELSDFVNMIFDQDATARTICRRLYRYFVRRNIDSEIENDIIEPLAITLKSNNYELEVTLKQLLKSQHFYDLDDNGSSDEIIGAIIKSPFELIAHALGFFAVDIPGPTVNPKAHYDDFYKDSVRDVILGLSGMSLFRPELVAGYPAYYQEPFYHRNWVNSATVIARYKIPEMLITGERILSSGDLGGGVKVDIVDFIDNGGVISDAFDAEAIVDELCSYLLPEGLSVERRNYFLNDVFLDELSVINWYFEWLAYKNTGVKDSVKIPLENLFHSILFSQEYQLM